MKNIINFAIIFVLLFSFGCNKEITDNILMISEIKNYLPNEYRSNTTVVFKNENNEELSLLVHYKEEDKLKTLENKSYTTEEIIITLSNPLDGYFNIKIIGSGSYQKTSDEVYKSLEIGLMPFSDPGNTWNSIRFINGKPRIITNDFHQTITLNSNEFRDVFTRIKTQDGFSELYFNKNEGIVAFSDRNNELWVFDRFEK